MPPYFVYTQCKSLSGGQALIILIDMEFLSSSYHGNAEVHMCTNLFCVDLFQHSFKLAYGGEDTYSYQGAAHV